MKLSSLAIIFIIIISPFIFISSQESEAIMQDQRLRYYYDNSIDNAIQDAALILSKNITELGYSNTMKISKAKELASQAFFSSIYHAFNAHGNPASMARVEACIPIMIFLENEGFSLYALCPFINDKGERDIKHCWFPMQHYIGEPIQERYFVRYTLGSKVYLYDNVEQIIYQGDYWEYGNMVSLFNDPETFKECHISAVKNSVRYKLKDYMNQHNQWTNNRSLAVQLDFPSIDDSDWLRALTDESILVFAQGLPVLKEKKYQHYALGGARVIRKKPIIGYMYHGILYYCHTDCNYFQNTVMIDQDFSEDNIIYFSDTFEAAKSGYFACNHCNP